MSTTHGPNDVDRPASGPSPDDPAPARTKVRGWKLLLFALAPTVLLVAVAEIGLRLTGLADSTLQTLPLPGEYAGLYEPDEVLFWSHRPSIEAKFLDVTVRTNDLGLRAPEVGPKQPDELRILSLGESTTFGAGVENAQTYTDRLSELLERDGPPGGITAINGGVSAYSSFQSLLYLTERGFALDPDIVLFYHELNDYLPSSLRDSTNTEVGLSRTDREMYESRGGALDRKLLSVSAIYRFLKLRFAKMRIDRLQRDSIVNPLETIGLPAIGLPPRVVDTDASAGGPTGLDETALPRRVSEQERRENLEELARACRDRGSKLLVIHPSYRDSTRHECLLTRFCRDHEVPMFDAYDALHPRGSEPGAFYLDPWHPNREGHRRLAEAIAAEIRARGWLAPLR